MSLAGRLCLLSAVLLLVGGIAQPAAATMYPASIRLARLFERSEWTPNGGRPAVAMPAGHAWILQGDGWRRSGPTDERMER